MKQQNRKNYPKTAEIVDELRQYWPDLQVKRTTENGGLGQKVESIYLGKGIYGCSIYLER